MIRIRVYPQPGSIGMRRHRARRQQAQLMAQIRLQQRLLAAQQMAAFGPSTLGPLGSLGSVGTFGSPFGMGGLDSYPSAVGAYPNMWSQRAWSSACAGQELLPSTYGVGQYGAGWSGGSAGFFTPYGWGSGFGW